MAKMVKGVVSVPVLAVGKLGYPELAEAVLREGKADFISLGRPLLADPEWPNKVKGGKKHVPCIGDYEGCNVRVWGGRPIGCTVNPACGRETELAVGQASERKSVLVVGGGPGGMEAAIISALRGHKVTLWEKAGVLGGNLLTASVPDFKEDYRKLIDYLRARMDELGVTVELGREATPELVQKLKPEVVIVATGSTPVVPDIPVEGEGRAVTAVDVLLGRKKAGESVAVVGGGSIGCEVALYLARLGKKTTIVEMAKDVACDMYVVSRMHLLKLLADAGVQILTCATVSRIARESVVVNRGDGGASTLKAETVVFAVGLRPYDSLSGALKGKVPEVHAIGDCVEPRRVIDAIWEAFNTARLV